MRILFAVSSEYSFFMIFLHVLNTEGEIIRDSALCVCVCVCVCVAFYYLYLEVQMKLPLCSNSLKIFFLL